MAEWFNAAVLKTVEGASPPRVRISASPPIVKKPGYSGFFFVGGAAQRSRACFRGAELSIRPGLVRRLSMAYRRDIIGFSDKNDIKGHFCLATLSANCKEARLFRVFFVGGAAQASRACFRGAELSIRPGLVRRLSMAYRRDIIGFSDKNDIKGHFCLATLSANTGFTQVK